MENHVSGFRPGTTDCDKALVLDLPDEDPKSGQHDRDSDQAKSESDTTLVALNHRVLAGLLILAAIFRPA